jgi:hypothetical protein
MATAELQHAKMACEGLDRQARDAELRRVRLLRQGKRSCSHGYSYSERGHRVNEPSQDLDWFDALHDRMASAQKLYESEQAPLRRRRIAEGMLAEVLNYLLMHPRFSSSFVHLPLKDLLLFLSDLERGRKHPWSEPGFPFGTNIATSSQSKLKLWVKAAFALLKRNGFEPVEAYRRLSAGLTETGRTGRKGANVRWQSVQTWCREPESTNQALVQQRIDESWNEFQRQHSSLKVIDNSGRLLSQKEIAGLFVDAFWKTPILRDRFNSPQSE